MSVHLQQTPLNEPLLHILRCAPAASPTLYWLGQAGFVLEGEGRRMLIDPYLSDSLAIKYHGAQFSHERLTPPPVLPDEFGPVDLVLCTHHHTDHMDAATLAPLANRWPQLRFVVPATAQDIARQRIGCDNSRLIAIDAGEHIEPFNGIFVHATRAAHETLETDDRQRHRYLGYVLRFGKVAVFHSGDCVPFEGQVEEVSALKPDLALLPVNGRSAALAEAGVPGNFHVEEAIDLCERCSISALIAHHVGLFAFNSVPPEALDAVLETAPLVATRARDRVAYGVSLA